MSPQVIGQRCVSEREPELGLGVVASLDVAAKRIGVEFPATREKRLYALGTGVLKRVQFRAGDTVTTREGVALVVATVEEREGLLTYVGQGRRVRGGFDFGCDKRGPAAGAPAGGPDGSRRGV